MPRGSATRRLRSVFGHAWHEERRALVGWTLGLVTLAVFQLAVYPTVREMQGMQRLLEDYPEPLREMFGLDDYLTGGGYLRSEIYALTAPLLLIVLAVLRGSDAIAGEEDRRTIDLLMANPVPRARVAVEKWLAVAAAVGVASVVLALTLGMGAPLVDLRFAWGTLAGVTIATVLLGLCFASLAFAIGAATGRRGLARGVTGVLVVASYLVSSLAPLVDWLRPVRPASPWYHALGVDPIGNGFSPAHGAVLVVIAAAFLAVAVVTFDRRDLAV